MTIWQICANWLACKLTGHCHYHRRSRNSEWAKKRAEIAGMRHVVHSMMMMKRT